MDIKKLALIGGAAALLFYLTKRQSTQPAPSFVAGSSAEGQLSAFESFVGAGTANRALYAQLGISNPLDTSGVAELGVNTFGANTLWSWASQRYFNANGLTAKEIENLQTIPPTNPAFSYSVRQDRWLS